MDSSGPEAECGDEADAGEVVAGELVIAGGYGTEVLETAEGALDDVARAVGGVFEGEAVHSVALVGDDGRGALVGEATAEGIAIVGTVGEQSPGGSGGSNQPERGNNVGCLADGQVEDVRPGLLVGEEVNLGRAPTARAADGLTMLPPFAPAAERCALTELLSIIAVSGGSPLSTNAAKIACHSPRRLQRL